MNRVEMFNEIQRILHASFTDKGVVQWWERKHPQLDNRTAYEAWHDHDHQQVLDLARSLEAGNCT